MLHFFVITLCEKEAGDHLFNIAIQTTKYKKKDKTRADSSKELHDVTQHFDREIC